MGHYREAELLEKDKTITNPSSSQELPAVGINSSKRILDQS
jgi:hypothetical protein